MAIEFACSGCGELVRVGEAAAGKKGKCPHCAAVVQIPAAAELSASPVEMSPSAAAPHKPSKLAFLCHHCGKTVNAPPAMIGKRGKCPFCQAFLIIGSDGPPATAPHQPQLVELTPLDEGLTPIGGLTPLPSAGLTPLGGGLQPLDANLLDSLPALSSAPLAGPAYVAKGNPFGGAATTGGNPLGAQTLNPYSPPSALSYGAPGPARSGGSGAPVKLAIPAVALIVVASLSLCYFAFLGITAMLLPVPIPPNIAQQGDPAMVQGYQAGVVVGKLVATLLGVVMNLLVIAGGVQMLRMKSLSTAKSGAIAALLPCNICWLGLPFGIWALVVLGQDDVWRRFRN